MLYVTNIIKLPYTGSLQSNVAGATTFQLGYKPNQKYIWSFRRALNEELGRTLLDFDPVNQVIRFSGLIDNPDKLLVKINADICIKLANGITYTIASTNITTKTSHTIITKKLKINEEVPKIAFQPYKDMIYLSMTVKDGINSGRIEPIQLKLETFGFDIVSK